ncbi:hypothetical protein GCM10010275_38230 [Streptomyces litmocidini]|nr:hypothetical protein GCM10010275_38230 [Streptomyces litmocidini]
MEPRETARAYARAHHPRAEEAGAHATYPVGRRAELGWTTRWTWTRDGVLVPRPLDVRIDRQGRVSRLDVTPGPTRPDPEASAPVPSERAGDVAPPAAHTLARRPSSGAGTRSASRASTRRVP